PRTCGRPRGALEGGGGARGGGACGPRRALSGAAVGGRAAAGGARAGLRDAAGDPACRRADRQSRRGHGQGDHRASLRPARATGGNAGDGEAWARTRLALRPGDPAPGWPARDLRGSGGVRAALRIALRELRGGLHGFRIFLVCLALGVAAIAAIGSVRAAVGSGLAREGAVILGGDAAIRFTHRFATPEEREWMEGKADRKTARRGSGW